MKLEPKQKYKTADYGTVTVKNIAKRGRGYSVTFAVRGSGDRTEPLQAFQRLTGNRDLSPVA